MLGIKSWTNSEPRALGPGLQKRENSPSRPQDRTIHINRPISTKLKDLGFRDSKNQAKYSVFSIFAQFSVIGLFLFVGLGLPQASVYAANGSYSSGSKAGKSVAIFVRSESQNSQTISLLEAATNVDPKKAMGGGDITMDDKAFSAEVGMSGTIADIQSSDHQGKVSIYVVRSGDTISQVAKMFGVSVETILWSNDLTRGASLREGQHLVILPIDGVQHTVKKGDTLRGIANKYKGDLEEIIEYNGMTVDQKLSIGDIVIIPGGKEVLTPTGVTTTSRSRTIASYPSHVGYYAHPIPTGHKTQGIHGYNGVDYGAPTGAPVYAAAGGTVIVSRFKAGSCGRTCFGGYGNYIVIEHPNGTQTLYGHLNAVYTSVGGRVEKGQWIGEVGNTGKSTGAHLHFEVRGAKNPF
ncbi:MAG: peptidoglycan DD-metalloendopeptidase family protein [Minisyncoccia bacterium]